MTFATEVITSLFYMDLHKPDLNHNDTYGKQGVTDDVIIDQLHKTISGLQKWLSLKSINIRVSLFVA